MTPWWMECCAAPVAVGFAMVFNVPPRFLAMCAALGVVGHATRWSVLALGGDLVLGTLLGALLISIGGLTLSRWRRDQSPLFTIAAAIPLVPGTALFHAVDGLIRLGIEPGGSANAAVLTSTAGYAAQGAMLVLALAFGLAAPALMAPRRHIGVPVMNDEEDDELAAESDRLRSVRR